MASARTTCATSDQLRLALGPAGATLAAILVLLPWARPGAHSLAAHMLVHLLCMGALAPLLAPALRRWRPLDSHRGLLCAVLLQALLFAAWHSPAAQDWARRGPAPMLSMHLSLTLVAVIFWAAVQVNAGRRAWSTAFALLFTGKLLCLVAAIWTFAPRALFAAMPEHPGHLPAAGGVADQQLAGTLMLVACPVLYLGVAAWVIVRRVFASPLPPHRLPPAPAPPG